MPAPIVSLCAIEISSVSGRRLNTRAIRGDYATGWILTNLLRPCASFSAAAKLIGDRSSYAPLLPFVWAQLYLNNEALGTGTAGALNTRFYSAFTKLFEAIASKLCRVTCPLANALRAITSAHENTLIFPNVNPPSAAYHSQNGGQVRSLSGAALR